MPGGMPLGITPLDFAPLIHFATAVQMPLLSDRRAGRDDSIYGFMAATHYLTIVPRPTAAGFAHSSSF